MVGSGRVVGRALAGAVADQQVSNVKFQTPIKLTLCWPWSPSKSRYSTRIGTRIGTRVSARIASYRIARRIASSRIGRVVATRVCHIVARLGWSAKTQDAKNSIEHEQPSPFLLITPVVKRFDFF